MKILLAFALLTCTAFAQLPDAPSASKGKDKEWNEFSGSYVLGWKETAKSPSFIWPYAGLWAATIVDIEITKSHLNQQKGCAEGNGVLPLYPTRAELYREGLLFEDLPVTALGFFLKKAGFKWWTIDGPAAYGIALHLHGATQWLTGRCN